MRPSHILFPICLAVIAAPAPAETIPLRSFNSIELEGGGDLIIREGRTQRVNLLRGDSRMTEFDVDHRGRLVIRACRYRCQNYRLQVEIVTPDVRALAIRGGGKIEAEGPFSRKGDLAVSIHGGGLIDVRGIPADRVAAAIHGGGAINVLSRSDLTASVNGGGAINYWGNPRITSAVRGGGAVNRVGRD